MIGPSSGRYFCKRSRIIRRYHFHATARYRGQTADLVMQKMHHEHGRDRLDHEQIRWGNLPGQCLLCLFHCFVWTRFCRILGMRETGKTKGRKGVSGHRCGACMQDGLGSWPPSTSHAYSTLGGETSKRRKTDHLWGRKKDAHDSEEAHEKKQPVSPQIKTSFWAGGYEQCKSVQEPG